MVFTRAIIIFAANTLALVSTFDIAFEALTVLLLALTVFAVTAFEVFVFVDSVFESLDVVFQSFQDGLLPLFLEKVVVLACIWLVEILVALTFWTTGSFVFEAFAVKLETVLSFAVALDALGFAFSEILLVLFSLDLSFSEDQISHSFNFFIVFFAVCNRFGCL